jgi:PEP-CTERM motif
VVHTDSAELRGAQGIPSSTAVALAGVTMNAAATVSGAQAQVVDFGGVAFGSVSFTGATLDSSTAFDFDTSALKVSAVGGADVSGLAVNDAITVSPTDMMYGSGSSGTRSAPIMTMWTNGIGTFEETFTDVESVDRGSANAITIDLAGNDHRSRLLGCVGLLDVVRQPDWRPGATISASFTNTTMTGESATLPPPPVIPEPSTWAMMLLGFVALASPSRAPGR